MPAGWRRKLWASWLAMTRFDGPLAAVEVAEYLDPEDARTILERALRGATAKGNVVTRGADARSSQLFHDASDPGVELLQAAGVHVRVVRALDLLAVVEQALFPPLHRHVRPLLAQGSRRRDRDDLVEPILGADLVEERNLGHGDLGRTGKLRQLLAPVQVLRRDARVKETLEPGERLPVTEDDLADLGRSISPSASRIPSPRRSSIAALTSGSVRIRWWTISSLETTAAPCRAKAFSASLFPAPMPP